ncbi:MAG: DUF4062 domain-containing protein [Acidobacteriia bacterium]|nr:DUF4062 domain-containing protein [Terriglobia bacterium]
MRENRLPQLRFPIFLSSKDSLVDERASVAEAIEDLYLNADRVETDRWLATPIPDEYVQQVRRCEMVILILAPVDTSSVHADYYKFVQAEIDVAISEGKPLLVFIRKGTYPPEADSFVDSIRKMGFSRVFENSSQLYHLATQSIVNEFIRRYSAKPELFTSRKATYDFLGRFIRKVTRRLVLSQLTPTPLLGPRRDHHHEQLLYKEFLAVLKQSTAPAGPEVILLFNEQQTLEELKSRQNDYDAKRFSACCDELLKYTSNRFRVIAAPRETIPYVVVDDKYAFGPVIHNKTLVIAHESAYVSTELYKMANDLAVGSPRHGIDRFREIAQTLQRPTQSRRAKAKEAGR